MSAAATGGTGGTWLCWGSFILAAKWLRTSHCSKGTIRKSTNFDDFLAHLRAKQETHSAFLYSASGGKKSRKEPGRFYWPTFFVTGTMRKSSRNVISSPVAFDLPRSGTLWRKTTFILGDVAVNVSVFSAHSPLLVTGSLR